MTLIGKAKLTLSTLPFLAAAAFGDMVPNGDFAVETDGMVMPWKVKAGALERRPDGAGFGRLEDASGPFLRFEGSGKGVNEHLCVTTGQYQVPVGFKYQLTFERRGSGLQPEGGAHSQCAMAYVDVFCDKKGVPKPTISNTRVRIFNNSKDWCAAEMAFDVPVAANVIQVRPQLVNTIPGNKAVADFRRFQLVPLDYELPDGGFEERTGRWIPFDPSKCAMVATPRHGGAWAAQVKDCPAGNFSGWSQVVPVREDRSYVFKGFAKGGVLKPNGFVGGAALCLQFLDAEGQPVGEPAISKAVPANTDWMEISTPPAQPPKTASSARLTCGGQYCGGDAYFDDLSLEMTPAATTQAARIKRGDVTRPEGVAFSKNLLANGELESNAGWTYHGSADKDWTAAQLQKLRDNGRPLFEVGRGRGEWSRSVAYAGKGSLLNISIDPPISTKAQWYGRSPVDGYWVSDAMPCEPGKAYLASGWLRPGVRIGSAWQGPLHIVFYGKDGHERPCFVRSILDTVPGNAWVYWFTTPYQAPAGAATMRLRFCQELQTDAGGWGRTYVDNLAVWEAPKEADLKAAKECVSESDAREWFARTHAITKPPFMPVPSESPEHECAWGVLRNATPGNLFHDPASRTALKLTLFNPLGVERELAVKVLRTDWKGEASEEIVTGPVAVAPFSEAGVTLDLPPTRSFGAFHLDCDILENGAKAGFFSGRYAVIPELNRPRATENIWAVTLLYKIHNDGRAKERELGEMLKTAGFGLSWVRDWNLSAEAMGEAKFFRSLGMKVVVQLHPPLNWKPTADHKIDTAPFFDYGKRVATAYRGMAAAYGDWGIEQSNHRSEAAPGYRPVKDGKFMDDYEYDQVYVAIRDGIRSVDTETPVLIGNIATDIEATAIKRMYGVPVDGHFDGAIINAYMGIISVCKNALAEFDRHGDTTKTVWQEENADQRSPSAGPARRYGEGEGASNMVRSWLSVACKCNPRIKAMTLWGFVGANDDTAVSDIFMLNSKLQPRPQFVAHAVMSDTLADAGYVGDRSTSDVAIFEFKRPDGPLFVIWAAAGEKSIPFDVEGSGLLNYLGLATPTLTVMDLMGNRSSVKAVDAVAAVKAGASPIYVFGAPVLALSHRLELNLTNRSRNPGAPALNLAIKNNQDIPVEASVRFVGAVRQVALPAGGALDITATVEQEPAEGVQGVFKAECVTASGAVFSTARSMNFATATRTRTPPPLDGTWNAWKGAKIIPFGESFQVVPPSIPGESYRGKGDIQGKIRLLWDEDFLYLGVEALDDVFAPNPERSGVGFMGDSIEFAFQPEGVRAVDAKYFEYELYLPGGKAPWDATRRAPLPSGRIGDADGWKASVTPTGHRGDANYQIAIPWKAFGVTAPAAGRSFTMALVLNDADSHLFTGGRKRIKWFNGVDSAKSPEKFGDITLVEEP